MCLLFTPTKLNSDSSLRSSQKFTGMNMLGVAQQASGVPGASQGNPSRDAGSKCEWMTSCVHPTYGTKTADAIGEVLWMDWLRNVTNI